MNRVYIEQRSEYEAGCIGHVARETEADPEAGNGPQ
jgi:hypothetical protein